MSLTHKVDLVSVIMAIDVPTHYCKLLQVLLRVVHGLMAVSYFKLLQYHGGPLEASVTDLLVVRLL